MTRPVDALRTPEGWETGRLEALATHRCVRCGIHAAAFRDEASVRDYRITALCQKCQDHVDDLLAEFERGAR